MKKLTSKVVLALALAVAASTGVATDVNAASKLKVKDNVTGKTTASTVKIAKGKKVKLTATSTLKKATSSNTKIATVKKSGKTATVTAKKKGTAKITLTAKNGKKATVKVEVKSGKVTKISLNKTKKTVHLGNTTTLKATVKATSGANKTVRWKASNSNVTVSSSGKVTAKKVGTAKVYAIATDGTGVQKYATITVDRKYTQVTLKESDATAAVKVTGAPEQLSKDLTAAAGIVLGDKDAQITVTVDGVDKVAEYKAGKITVDGKDLSVVESKSGVVTVKVTQKVVDAVKGLKAVAALAGDTYKDVVVEIAGRKLTNVKSTSSGKITFNVDGKDYVAYASANVLNIQGSATDLKADLEKVATVKSVYLVK